MDWERGSVVWAYDDWKPVAFCAGLLALYAVFQWRLKRTAGAELLPYVWARRGVLAAGAAGLGLLGWTARRWSRRKKPKEPLADPQK